MRKNCFSLLCVSACFFCFVGCLLLGTANTNSVLAQELGFEQLAESFSFDSAATSRTTNKSTNNQTQQQVVTINGKPSGYKVNGKTPNEIANDKTFGGVVTLSRVVTTTPRSDVTFDSDVMLGNDSIPDDATSAVLLKSGFVIEGIVSQEEDVYMIEHENNKLRIPTSQVDFIGKNKKKIWEYKHGLPNADSLSGATSLGKWCSSNGLYDEAITEFQRAKQYVKTSQEIKTLDREINAVVAKKKLPTIVTAQVKNDKTIAAKTENDDLNTDAKPAAKPSKRTLSRQSRKSNNQEPVQKDASETEAFAGQNPFAERFSQIVPASYSEPKRPVPAESLDPYDPKLFNQKYRGRSGSQESQSNSSVP
ncbi:MAG: hypothetical protein ACRC2T_09125 [Thermoguttaceae bacterium]